VLCPKIFIRARDWPRLPSAHPTWDRGPPKNFNRENLKFGLKFSVCTSITSGLMGISSQLFIQTACCWPRVIMWVQFLDGMPPNIWTAKKPSKIWRDFWQLSTLIANISERDPQIENRKLINYNPSHVGRRKDRELWSTDEEVIDVHIDPPKWTFFWRLYCGP